MICDAILWRVHQVRRVFEFDYINTYYLRCGNYLNAITQHMSYIFYQASRTLRAHLWFLLLLVALLWLFPLFKLLNINQKSRNCLFSWILKTKTFPTKTFFLTFIECKQTKQAKYYTCMYIVHFKNVNIKIGFFKL